MLTVLIVVAAVMVVGAIPAWPYSRDWGYGPIGSLGLLVLVLVGLFLAGRLA